MEGKRYEATRANTIEEAVGEGAGWLPHASESSGAWSNVLGQVRQDRKVALEGG